jgi:hypothetical protein
MYQWIRTGHILRQPHQPPAEGAAWQPRVEEQPFIPPHSRLRDQDQRDQDQEVATQGDWERARDVEAQERSTVRPPALTDDPLGALLSYPVVTDRGEPVGRVIDLIGDAQGSLRYFLVDAGQWVFGKKLPVPVGLVEVQADRQQIVLRGLTQDQARRMPGFEEQGGNLEDYENHLLEHYLPGQPLQRDSDQWISYKEYSLFTPSASVRSIQDHLQRHLSPTAPQAMGSTGPTVIHRGPGATRESGSETPPNLMRGQASREGTVQSSGFVQSQDRCSCGRPMPHTHVE